MTCCPTCGRPLPTDPERVLASKADELREACLHLGIAITWDGLVNEPGACELLGYSRDTLRRQIEYGKDRIRHLRRGNRRLYALADLARYLVAENADSADIP
ncbi:hypothetical protein D9M70_457620 [compost metagenome]